MAFKSLIPIRTVITVESSIVSKVLSLVKVKLAPPIMSAWSVILGTSNVMNCTGSLNVKLRSASSMSKENRVTAGLLKSAL